jgi:hypothetical protein
LTLAPQLAEDARLVLNDYLPQVSLSAEAWARIEELVARLEAALGNDDASEFERALIEIEQRGATRLPAVGQTEGQPSLTPAPPQLREFMNKLVHTLDDYAAEADGERP